MAHYVVSVRNICHEKSLFEFNQSILKIVSDYKAYV